MSFQSKSKLPRKSYEPIERTLLQKCSKPIKLIKTEDGTYVQKKDQCGIKAANSFFNAKVKKRRYLNPSIALNENIKIEQNLDNECGILEEKQCIGKNKVKTKRR